MDKKRIVSYGLLILIIAVFTIPVFSKNNDHGFPRMNMVAQSFWLNTWATDTCAYMAQWDTVFNTDAASALDSTQLFEQKTQMNILGVAELNQGNIDVILKGAFRNGYNAYAPEYVVNVATATIVSEIGLIEWLYNPRNIDIGYDFNNYNEWATGIYDDLYVVVDIATGQTLMMKAAGEGY